MKFPDKLDVLAVHARLISETGGSPGLRDEGLLESALAAAENRHSYEGADLVTCAATYAYHLTQAHAFVDGNKRTGFVVGVLFVELNGFDFQADEADATQAVLALAAGEMDERSYGTWLQAKPFTTSFTVPSPPQTITRSREASTARRAIWVASPGAVVICNSVSVPAFRKMRLASSSCFTR